MSPKLFEENVMLIKPMTERYSEQVLGVISCLDRVVLTGTLQCFGYAHEMTNYLYRNNIRIFDFPKFADSLRIIIRENAEKIASENGLDIEYIRKNNFRKESRIKEILKERGDHPGLVHIFSAMESCPAYKPWHDKITHKTFLKHSTGKCIHYYFYFIDEDLGLCYVRVPSWAPFRLQIYFNGHNLLASKLDQHSIKYQMLENAFTNIDDFQTAQKLSDEISVEKLHSILNRFSELYCPVGKEYGLAFHWSIMQAEYATDIIFRKQEYLQAIYDNLTHCAIHTVKPDNIATFLGRKLHPNYQDEMGNRYNIRIEGTRIKHSMGKVSIKMYDKFGQILRIETTVNDVSFFKHYREVRHRDGTTEMKNAQMRKSIYSLNPLIKKLAACNSRYIDFISTIEDNQVGTKKLEKISKPVTKNNRNYKGFNFFDEIDLKLFEIIVRGEFNISGFQNKEIRKYLKKTSSQVCRMLKRLRVHGLIKKVPHSYKYYLTKLGRQIIATGLKLKELVIIPDLTLAFEE